MSSPSTKEENATGVADTLQELAAQIHGIYQPQWNARADVLKTIVSLSSASIVLSVTFSSSLRALKLGPNWNRLIVLSFVLLVLSLIVALIALWIGMRVYGIQSSVFDARLEIR